ncbi:MAG TPA: MarR family transcriptional regulator [Acidimicrobiia bacterium]|nr:MarR family transcriptional regulator [Acidimicrobiia bacterium]
MTTRVKPTTARTAEAALPRPTYLVKQLQEALLRRLDDITRRFDLTTRQYTTLSVLAKYPGISSAQLARLTFVSPQAANEMVGTLEGKGFLRRAVDRGNRRRLEVKLTPAATRALSKCDAQVDALERELFRDVEPEDKAHFHRMLDTCLRAISEVSSPADRG